MEFIWRLVPLVPKSSRSFDITYLYQYSDHLGKLGRQFTSREYKCMGDNSPIGLDALRPRNILALFKQLYTKWTLG